MKQAYASATDQQATGALLNRLFHTAFTAGKRVRSETELAEGAVSVSYAALGLARKIVGDLRHASVLVVGAGEMAELTARHFAAQQPKRITVCSRTAAHAEALAATSAARVVPWERSRRRAAQADVVVTATGATTPILTRKRVQRRCGTAAGVRCSSSTSPLPRDVDPLVAGDDDVFLYNIDDLQSVINESLARRSSETTHAETIVNQEVERFMAWSRSRTAMPTVVALRQRFDAIRRAELDRLQPKIAGLPPEARARVDEITRLIIEKLLITPTEQLKALPDQELLSSLRRRLSHLFALGDRDDDEDDDEPGPPGGKGRGSSSGRDALGSAADWTRGSTLALWQAREVARRLEAVGEPSEIVIIRTSGDWRQRGGHRRVADRCAGKRLFVKEIEDALLAGSIDLGGAQHQGSAGRAAARARDGGVPAARDAVGRARAAGAPRRRAAHAPKPCRPSSVRRRYLGTSSIRRITQLHRLLPGATFEPIRGNVDTRLRKVDEGATMPSCWRAPGSSGSASPIASRWRCR